MRIAICDDDRDIAELFKAKVKAEDAESEILVFATGIDLINSDISFDAAFLDIEMPEANGFKVAKHLRAHQPKCIFSFITTHAELAVDGYDYQPFRYILKTAPEPVIKRKIQETLQECRCVNRILQITYKGTYSSVFVNDILYIEIVGHCMKLVLEKGELLWGRQLNEAEAELENYGLIRCHRSYMVALLHIDKITLNKADMKNGAVIPIGRKYKDHFMEKYNNFMLLN